MSIILILKSINETQQIMKRQIAFWVLLLALLTLQMTPNQVSLARANESSAEQSTIGDLVAQATKNGHVRVIIALNIPFKPEPLMATVQVTSQRSLIQQTQLQVKSLLAGTNAQSIVEFETIPYISIDADSTAIERLSASGLVHQIIKENVLRPLLAQSVPHIGAPAAWAAGYDGTNQTVAVLDTGVDKSHPFLAGKVVSEACYSLSGGINVPLCPNGVVSNGISSQTSSGAATPCTVEYCLHGTHVAGIAAGSGITFSGVAKGAKIIAIQVFHKVTDNDICTTSGFSGAPCVLSSDSEILKALERVYQLRSTYSIAAVNLSLGGGRFGGYCDQSFPYYYSMFEQLRSVGIAVVAGTGNERLTDAIYAPSCISNAISVGATNDTTDVIWDSSSIFGNSGSNSAAILDLLAPGANITSSVPGGGYLEESGTSMATPHVAGAIAVLRSAKPTATVEQMLTALQNTGVPVTDPINKVITPRIQVDTAATALVNGTLPTIGKIAINEIRVQNNQSIELLNMGSSSVNMTGWQFIIYAGNGTTEKTYTFPSFTLPNGGYVVLNKGTGSSTSTNLYIGDYSTTWASNGNGAALLKTGNIGIDFVRWGSSTLMPPNVTGWSGQNPSGPASGQNLGRDPLTGDTGDAGDWSAQPPTLGTINQPIRPANDDFANNILVPGLPYSASLPTFTATRQNGEPSPTCSPDIGRTVWYRYIPTTSSLVGFDTVGSDFDSSIAIYTGNWGSLTEVACNDDITLGTLIQSKIVLSANAGVTYYIQVGGLNAIGGHLNFRVDIPMLNDQFNSAAVINALPYTISQDTTTSTESPSDPYPSCNFPIPVANSVWFRYTAVASETIRFETTGSDYDTILSVWTGTEGNLTEKDCHDDKDPIFGLDLTSQVDIPVVAGTSYYIMIDGGIYGSSGNLTFKASSLATPPVGLNPPVLALPDDGTIVPSTTPTFSWDRAFNATSYQIQLSTSLSFANVPVTLTQNSYKPTVPLLTTTYYWRVRSLGTGGAISAWSQTRTVVIASQINAAPSRNFFQVLPITLTWGHIDWATEYEIQIDNEPTFANPRRYDTVVPTNILSFQLSTLESGSYYWRVRARRPDGTWGLWSVSESFTYIG